MIYIVQCKTCTAKEEFLGAIKYFPSWLETHRCKFCGGELKKVPAKANFTIENGTPIYGGKK